MNTAFQDVKRILVVDDEDLSRRVVTEILGADSDYRIFEASSIADAEEVIRGQIIDLIVLDLLLPDKTGFDLLTERRTSRSMIRRKVLVTSTLDDRASVERAALLGADDYLLKPVKRDQLLAKVRKLLGETR